MDLKHGALAEGKSVVIPYLLFAFLYFFQLHVYFEFCIFHFNKIFSHSE